MALCRPKGKLNNFNKNSVIQKLFTLEIVKIFLLLKSISFYYVIDNQNV